MTVLYEAVILPARQLPPDQKRSFPEMAATRGAYAGSSPDFRSPVELQGK